MKVIIEYSTRNNWTVKIGERYADHLSYDEMLGLVAALTMPNERPCMHWLKTKEEHDTN